jgi:hypothetical protein
MIAEALEWLVTPASSLARQSGLLAGQIAIRHRAARCRSLWQGHLQATRSFITNQIAAILPRPQQVIVLGSGHLNDVDLQALLDHADHVVLVDIVHPLDVRWKAFRAEGRIELIEADISGALASALAGGRAINPVDEPLRQRILSADCVISVNILSQLPIGAQGLWTRSGCSEAEIDRLSHSIIKAHLDLLVQSRHAVLISDQAARLRGPDDNGAIITGTWQDLLFGFALAQGDEEWIWNIASATERGDGYEEERKVVAMRLATHLETSKSA